MIYNDFGRIFVISKFFDKTTGLFSRDYEPLVDEAIRRSLEAGELRNGWLGAFPEFPLIGDSWLDLTVTYKSGFCHEYDLSKRGINDPTNIYFTKKYVPGTEADILRPIDALDFTDALALRLKALPKEWRFSYCGRFKGRGESALRIGCYYHGKIEPQAFFGSLEDLGFTCVSDHMKETLRPLFRDIFSTIEVSLNLNPDGSLNDNIGIIFEVPKYNGMPGGSSLSSFKECGYEDFLISVESMGLIDSRWKIARDAISTQKYKVPGLGEKDECTVYNGFLGIKLPFKGGEIQQSKMYMNFYLGV